MSVRWRTVAPFVIAALVVAAIAGSIAAAGRNDVVDPNDTRGVLDVRAVRFKDPTGDPPQWTILTFDGWSLAKIWDRGYLYVQLDTFGAESADYAAVLRSTGRNLVGHLFKLGKGNGGRDVLKGSLTARKGSAASVSVKVSLKRLKFGEQRTFYRWWVVTTLSSGTCPRVCVDRAPNDGSVLEYRPGMSPTPSPTP